MAVILFIIILFVLVLVHEFGHFIIAKWAGMRVDEFGFGFPPRAATLFRKNGTDYTLNWIPFGGFVKIYGEDGEEPAEAADQAKKAIGVPFTKKSKWWQAFVLVAGVSMNVIMAWLLLSFALMAGMPTSVQDVKGAQVTNPALTITDVTAKSPAERAGLESGDVVTKLSSNGDSLTVLNPDTLKTFVVIHGATPITISVLEGKTPKDIVVTPEITAKDPTPTIGISMDMVGKLKLGFFAALGYGAQLTVVYTKHVVSSLVGLIAGIFHGTADLSTVTGPVGLVGIVGQAYQFGIAYLLSLAALISINLAAINLLPFPALDGGRLLFVIIEAIIRRPINQKVANWLNTIGFFLLIVLMLVVTVRDVIHLF